MNYKVNYPKHPYIVGWSITNKCNLRCLHCNMDSGQEWSDELTFEECCRVIDDLAEYNVKTILFTGGEPLTRKDFFDICDYAVFKKINIGLTTNGTLITDDIIENQFWKFQALRVSLDSRDASEHDRMRNLPGTFEKATASIRKMKRCGYNVSVSTCVSKRNIASLEKMAAMGANACPAGITELTLFANGDLSPCFAMVTLAGNVREDNIIDVWENHPMFKAFRNRELLKGKCKDCNMLMKCGGGCRANPFIMNNDYLGEDEVCWK